MKDWNGNKNSVFKTLGASNHTDKERQNEDYYATEPKAGELPRSECGKKLHSFNFTPEEEIAISRAIKDSKMYFEKYGKGLKQMPIVDRRKYY